MWRRLRRRATCGRRGEMDRRAGRQATGSMRAARFMSRPAPDFYTASTSGAPAAREPSLKTAHACGRGRISHARSWPGPRMRRCIPFRKKGAKAVGLLVPAGSAPARAGVACHARGRWSCPGPGHATGGQRTPAAGATYIRRPLSGLGVGVFLACGTIGSGYCLDGRLVVVHVGGAEGWMAAA